MAAKKTLNGRRNGASNFPEMVDRLIERHVDMLRNPKLTGSVTDLIRLVQLAQELDDTAPSRTSINWID